MAWTNMASVWNFWTGRRDTDSKERIIVSNLLDQDQRPENHPNRNYVGNGVKTTKYTIWNFIILNLYEQFHRVANMYFVFLVALNFVPAVNAFQPEVALIPICVILSLTAMKDAWEDFRRYQSDRKLNGMPCLVYSRSQRSFVVKRWKDVRVGDFVRVLSNEIVPADILLLHTSNPNGVCYMETANLDGETNLKQRKVVPGFSTQNAPFEPLNFSSTVVCTQPNKNLKDFNGFLEKNRMKTGFDIESLLLRGCTVRNTADASGIVVYAGHESKSMLNNGKPRYKRSKLEKKMNKDVILCVILLFSMCLIGAIGHCYWLESFPTIPMYFIPEDDGSFIHPLMAGFNMFFTMIILLQVMIPISLYLSIELVKIGQVYFITQDLDLYDEEKDSRVQCRALNITEDLGQIQYVFSDKTGTLTENKMVFRRCTIMGTEFAHEENARRLSILAGEVDHDEELIFQKDTQPSLFSLDEVQDDPTEGSMNGNKVRSRFHRPSVRSGTSGTLAFSSPLETEVFPDQTLLQRIDDAESGKGHALYLEFFLALAICNTVVVSTKEAQRQRARGRRNLSRSESSFERVESMLYRVASIGKVIKGKGSSSSEPLSMESPVQDAPVFNGSRERFNYDTTSLGRDRTGSNLSVIEEVCYEAQSPDEAALVHAAKAYGFILKERAPNHVIVQLPQGKLVTFEVLDILDFDSTRRRMSIIVRHHQTKEIIMYTKGADSSIMERLQNSFEGKSQRKTERRNIADKTQKDLDMYARDGLRTLCFTRKVISEQDYNKWLVMRQEAKSAMEKKEELLGNSAAYMENDLTLLGATGIEDRLQDSVPETIQTLREAGIQVWVLTGDKLETAVNIAYSCKLLDQSDLVFTFKMRNKEYCRNMLNGILRDILRSRDELPRIGLVINGETLDFLLDNDLQPEFLQLCQHSRSVLCCRATPLHKSIIVTLIRDRFKVMTLAIGDGANDVNMIQAADVGIGISGQEGMQAVMASDFAISRFKHLKKLLLVHGHSCYTRLANMIIYFFYKNVAYVNLLFWYQFFCGFSGTAMIDYWFMIFFNLLFTSAPPIMFGIMDRDVSSYMLLHLPELYKNGQRTEGYCRRTFWIAIVDAFYQSLVCFFVPYWTYKGSDVGIFSLGTPMQTVSLFTIIFHLAIEIKSWTAVHWVIMVGSILTFFIVTLAFSAMCITCNPPSNPYWIMQKEMNDPVFYLVCILSIIVALLPRFLVHAVRGTLVPSDHLTARKVDKLPPENRDIWLREWKNLKSLCNSYPTVSTSTHMRSGADTVQDAA